ncbi:MAG: anion permease [Vulcanimicrobiaceae bacterium]
MPTANAAPLSQAAPPHATGLHRLPWKAMVPIALAVVIALVPAPRGLAEGAWLYFALFVGVIAGLILEPIPAAAVGFIGVSLATALQFVGGSPAEALKWGLSGFADSTVWLIFAAYMFAEGYEKTGLGRRIALALVGALGKKTLGLGYAVALADLVLAPFTPSNTARSGGTIYPIVKNIPPLYGSLPGESARKIGSYLLYTAFAATCVTSAMFLTALAPNLLAVDIIGKAAGVHITWTRWFIGFLPVGIILFLSVPLVVYWLYPPELKEGSEVSDWARNELAQMGRISRKEGLMAGLAVAALVLWICGSAWLNATTVALLVVSAMVVSGIISWNELLANKQAWNVLVWFATLVALADGLSKVGFLPWFTKGATGYIAGVSPAVIVLAVVALFFVIHYLFASLTAQATALLPVFASAVVALPGVNAAAVCMLLAYTLGLMGVITPYACGPAPIYYGSGYIASKDFWRLGSILGAVFLVVLLVVGVPYVMTMHP